MIANIVVIAACYISMGCAVSFLAYKFAPRDYRPVSTNGSLVIIGLLWWIFLPCLDLTPYRNEETLL